MREPLKVTLFWGRRPGMGGEPLRILKMGTRSSRSEAALMTK